ncbi:FG-GAP-like repeat-containing protein [Aquirufa sp.]|uniref:InlB B-repeat-containing protein n=1 Tax=Aquirufa sp. TaxID=2676249 RepID=UPI0037C0189A
MRQKLRYFSLCILFMVSCSKEDAIPTYQLLVDVTPVSGGSVTPNAGSFMKGESVQLLAKPASEYLFKEWKGAYTGSTNPGSIVMDADKRITGVFEKRQYPLNVTIEGNGTIKEEIVAVASQAQYPSGTTVKLTAIPAAGAKFSEWKGDITSKDSVITTIVNKAISLQAIFQVKGPDYSTKYTDGWPANMSKTMAFFNVHPESIKVIKLQGKYHLISAYADLFGTTYDSFRSFEIDSVKGQMTENTSSLLGGYYTVGFPKSPFFYEDLNGDGIKDLFEVDHGKETESEKINGQFRGFKNHLFLGTADGKFTYANVPELTDIKRFHHNADIGDIDGDGDNDLLLQVFNDDEMIYFKNDKGLKKDRIINPANSTGSVLVDDIDNDGQMDLISAPYIERSNTPTTHVLKINLTQNAYTRTKISSLLPFGANYGCYKLFEMKNPKSPNKKNIFYFVEAGIGQQKVFRSSESDMTKVEDISTLQSTYSFSGMRDFLIVDLNFDGLDDVLFFTNGEETFLQRVWINKGNNTFEHPTWEINPNYARDYFVPLSFDAKNKRVKFFWYANGQIPSSRIVNIYTGKR